MKKLLLLFALASSFVQAQTTLLCEDNFDNAQSIGCNITITYNSLQRINQKLSTNLYTQEYFQLANQGLSSYDTLKLEMDFDLMNSNFINNMFYIYSPPAPLSIYYKDAATNKSYSGNANDSPLLKQVRFDLSGSNIVTFNNTTKKLVLRFAKPSDNPIFASNYSDNRHFVSGSSWGAIDPPLSGFFNVLPDEDQNFATKLKQSFCATTGNPTDCLNKATFQPIPIMGTPLTIDNFKAYGIKKVVTGIEEETKTNPRTLIGLYNTMGQKLDADQMHEGLVIKMYSDGTKEKIISSK